MILNIYRYGLFIVKLRYSVFVVKLRYALYLAVPLCEIIEPNYPIRALHTKRYSVSPIAFIRDSTVGQSA